MGFWNNLIRKFIPSHQPEETPVDWEALLIEADLGLTLTLRLVGELEKRKLMRKNREAEAFLRETITQLVQLPPLLPISDQPEVILLVGVNGSGKTTTAAKLARRWKNEGRTVVLGAADTFRAAAREQLEMWGKRLDVEVVGAPSGSDPASVAYRAYEVAENKKAQGLIVDTAGRLANKNNLMLEIAKVKRVLGKKNSRVPHHTWLVADGTSGANVLSQAREFHQACGLTGVILTKLDGSARGGMIAAVREETGLPTVFLGRGEKDTDLLPFDARQFAEEFFS